jgi:hypothetical protein
LKNKLSLIRTEAKASQLRKKKGNSRDKLLLNSRHGILNLPDIAVLTGEQHQGHQGPAHQQQEGGQKLNSLEGQMHESDIRELHTISKDREFKKARFTRVTKRPAHQKQEGGEGWG